VLLSLALVRQLQRLVDNVRAERHAAACWRKRQCSAAAVNLVQKWFRDVTGANQRDRPSRSRELIKKIVQVDVRSCRLAHNCPGQQDVVCGSNRCQMCLACRVGNIHRCTRPNIHRRRRSGGGTSIIALATAAASSSGPFPTVFFVFLDACLGMQHEIKGAAVKKKAS
jgi:hypothetical protein